MYNKTFLKTRKIIQFFLVIWLITTFSGVLEKESCAEKTVQPTIDIIKLLDYTIRSQKQGFDISHLTLSSTLSGKTVKVLADSYDLSRLNVYLPVQANYPENTYETITFVICNESDICLSDNLWIGNVFSDTVLIPGKSYVNIRSYLTGSLSSQNLSIYGLINAQIVQTEPSVGFSFHEVINEPIQVRLDEISASVDADSNGIPENLNSVLLPGELWVANQWVNNGLRNVYIYNLNILGEKTTLIPLDKVEIEAPTLSKLKSLGLLSAEIDFVCLVIVVSEDLSAQTDEITQGEGDLSAWINSALSNTPGKISPQMGYMGVYLICSDNQGGYRTISFADISLIKVIVKNTSKPDWVQLKAFQFPGVMVDTTIPNDSDDTNKWTLLPTTENQQELTIDVQRGGIIALYETGLNITKATPNKIPKGIEVPLTLQGIIPVSTAMNITQVSELYEVRIGGVSTEFRDNSPEYPNIAITAYDGANENQIFITAPAVQTVGPVELEIIDKKAEGVTYVFPDIISVVDVFQITAEIERGPNVQSPNARITVTPSKNSYLPDEGMFLDGDTVTLSIQNIDEEDQFVGWYAQDGTLLSRFQEFSIPAKENLSLKARIHRRQYTLTITIDPLDKGMVLIDPPGETFAPGTEVKLTAEPVPGFKFKHWFLAENKTSTENPLTITIDKDYAITAVFEPGPPELSGIAQLASGNFEIDSQGKERLVVWAFGGIVWRVNGYNLKENTSLQLVDSQTGKEIGSPFTGIRVAEDGSYLDFIIPPYPLYSDDMPAYVDVDLKTGEFIIPAFRYYHYVKDNFNIYTTAFKTDLTKSEKISIYVEGSPQGSIQFPVLEESEDEDVHTTYGLIRVIRISNNPTSSAVASLLGNTLIHGGIYGLPVENMYEVAYYLYQPDTFKEPPEVGTAVYTKAEDKNNKTLFTQPVYPYNLDGSDNDVPTIKITLPANGLNYNIFRAGISVFGQSSEFDYVKNQVIPGLRTAYQSQILSSDLDPVMTENIMGTPNKMTLRVYTLNGFGIRTQSLLPFEVTSLARIASDNGVQIVKTAGDEEVNIVSPKGGLGYVDRIELINPDKEIDKVVRPESTNGEIEGLLTFKTPKVEKSGIVDIYIYLKSQPDVPAVILENTMMYSRTPIILDSWILIPVGLILTTLGFVAGGSSNGGGPCFIATAAYGTPLAEEIDILRQFRDQYLLTNPMGTAFVDMYYNLSPPLASWIAHHPFVAFLTRCALTPIVWLSKFAILYPILFHLLIIFSIISMIYYSRRKRQKLTRNNQNP